MATSSDLIVPNARMLGFTPGDPRLKYDTPKVLYHLIGQGIQCICGILTDPTYDGWTSGGAWKRMEKGQQSCNLYMAAFMDNMENSKVLTIIKRTIWQCIYWKGITCQHNSTI